MTVRIIVGNLCNHENEDVEIEIVEKNGEPVQPADVFHRVATQGNIINLPVWGVDDEITVRIKAITNPDARAGFKQPTLQVVVP